MPHVNVDPFMDKHSPVYQFLMEITPESIERIAKYRRFWRLYEGEHWASYDERNETLNYISTLVDVKVKFLTDNGFEIKIPEDPLTAKSEKTYSNYIKYVLDDCWSRNKKDTLFIKIANTAHVTGDCYIRPRIALDKKYGDVFVSLDVIQPHLVFPIYGIDNTYEREYMSVCYVFTPIMEDKDKLNKQQTAQRMLRQQGMTTRVGWTIEEWTDEKVTVYRDKINKENIIFEREHEYNEIPVVHIKNKVYGNSDFGRSDIENIDKSQKLYNEKASKVSEIIDYHAAPILFLKGARIELAEVGPDKILQTSNPDAKLDSIGLPDDLSSSTNFLSLVKSYMLEESSVPEQAINPTKNISNTPGVALHMAYLPLISDRKHKKKTYGDAIKDVNRLILKMQSTFDIQLKEMLDNIPRGKYRTEISFGPDLPRDESLELDKTHSKLDMGITTKVEALVDMGYGREDAERIINENLEERRAILELEAEFGKVDEQTKQAPFGKRRRPDPIVQGDKVSSSSS